MRGRDSGRVAGSARGVEKMGYGVIPDLRELERWIVREGLTPTQASERYAADGVHVSPQTIAVARWRNGWPTMRADHTALIPWRIKAEHRRRFDHVMLEAESRRRQGLKVPEPRVKQLDQWLDRLKRDDVVVHYSPDAVDRETGDVPGWWHVRRRVGVDVDIISMPDLDDEKQVRHLRPGAPDVLRQLVESSAK